MNKDPLETTKKTLMVDTTFLFDQYSLRGIGKFGKELLKRMIKDIVNNDEWKLSLIGFWDLEKNLMQIGLSNLLIEEIIDKITFFSVGEPRLSNPKNVDFWDKFYRPVINTERPDIFFSVNFEKGLPTVTEFRQKLKFIPATAVIAHDAIPIVTDIYSKKSFVHNFFKKKFYLKMFTGVQNADLVITPSEFSKNDLVNYGKVNENKIQVVNLGVDEKFNVDFWQPEQTDVSEILHRYKVEAKNYFIYDSGLEANKGSDILLHIFSRIAALNKKAVPKTLLITGGSFDAGSGKNIKSKNLLATVFLKKAKKLNVLDNIVTTSKISDEELIILLRNSFAHLNFSQYEGFNLGPVQAMASKIPSIAANASCNPEITKGGALLVNTNDLESAFKQIKQFITDPEEIKKQVKKGSEVVKDYDWNKTSDKIWELVQRI